MSQRVQVMGSIGLPVAHDILDHLTPDGGVALDREIEPAKVKLADLAHICSSKTSKASTKLREVPFWPTPTPKIVSMKPSRRNCACSIVIWSLRALKNSTEGNLTAINGSLKRL